MPTATAIDPGDPVITTVGGYPVSYDEEGTGHVLAPHGAATSFTVDWTGAEEGSYTLRWSCFNEASRGEVVVQVPEDTAAGTVEYPIDITQGDAICSIRVLGDLTGTEYYVRLLQLDPQIAVSNFQVLTGANVYPRVHKDRWSARFETNSPAEITTEVRNKAGRVVFSRTSSTYRAEYRSEAGRIWDANVFWNGLRNDGTQLPLGTYRVKVKVRSTFDTGRAVVGPMRVTIKPGRRPISVSDRRSGRSGSNYATPGCFSADQITGMVWLNCSLSSGGAGSLARSTWTFKVPRSAKLDSWKVKGSPAGDDLPGTGSVLKTLKRPKPTLFRMTVTVTGRRSFVVSEVVLKYTYLK